MPLSQISGGERFLPTTRAEMNARGWDELDVLCISGDAYIDHPAFGIPLLARWLESQGFRVGILAQPDWRAPECFREMGRPRLFAALSAGAMDSMVSHYTASRRRRREDAYSPGGRAGLRPDRALTVYCPLLKGIFKGLPLLIGGIEASLRRFAHYDYWSDKIRRSILLDSKADLLVHGMGESPLLEICRRAAQGEPLKEMILPGTARISKQAPPGFQLPSFEAVQERGAFLEAFRLIQRESRPWAEGPLIQAHGARSLVVEPPPLPLKEAKLDQIYDLPFERRPHSSYREKILAFEQIKGSITSHRGCFGGCAFCAISLHQGKQIQSRSEASILREIRSLAAQPGFSGTITDLGGPTANMYGLGCSDSAAEQSCRRPSCLHPKPCKKLRKEGRRAASLLKLAHREVQHLFVASGLRHDLLRFQPRYQAQLLEHHVGGLLKLAPEAVSPEILRLMRKPEVRLFSEFLRNFRAENRRRQRRRGLVPYFIAGHPGSRLSDMIDAALFLKAEGLKVEQVQLFTPTPGSEATCMWFTGLDPRSGEEIHIPRSERERRLQRALLLYHLPEHRRDVREALRRAGRERESYKLLGRLKSRRPRR